MSCLAEEQLCALVSRRNGESPIGSASRYERLLLLEFPLPWPRNALQAPQLRADVRQVLADLESSPYPCSRLALQSDPYYSRPNEVRVVYFRRPGGRFADFAKLELSVPEHALAGTLRALLLEPDEAVWRPYRQSSAHLRDILVCTHETRDVCLLRSLRGGRLSGAPRHARP